MQFMWKTVRKSNSSKNTETRNGNEEDDAENSDKTYIEKVFHGLNSFIDVNLKIFDWMFCFFEMQFFKVVLIFGFMMSISEVSFRF